MTLQIHGATNYATSTDANILSETSNVIYPSTVRHHLSILSLYNTTAPDRSFAVAPVKSEALGNVGGMANSPSKERCSILLTKVASYLHEDHITRHQVHYIHKVNLPRLPHMCTLPKIKSAKLCATLKTKKNRSFVNQTVNNSHRSPGRRSKLKHKKSHDFSDREVHTETEEDVPRAQRTVTSLNGTATSTAARRASHFGPESVNEGQARARPPLVLHVVFSEEGEQRDLFFLDPRPEELPRSYRICHSADWVH